MKGCQKYSHHTFFFSVIAISKLHNLQDQIRTLLGRNVGKSKGNKIKMGEGKFKVFSRFVGMSTLFGISIQQKIFFFTSSSSSKQYSFLPFHFSKFDENPFYFLLFDTFPFFFFFFFKFFFLFFFFLL